MSTIHGRARVSSKRPIQEFSPEALALLAEFKPTRQLVRALARKEEYMRFGIGLGRRPVYNESRKVLRAMARAIVQQNWKASGGMKNFIK